MSFNDLMHYGTPQPFDGSPTGSGRYRKGSGDNPYQHKKGFNGYVNDLRRQGLSDTEIAEGLGFKSTTELRATMAIEGEKYRASQMSLANRLLEEGYSKTAIGERMGINESQVRSLLKQYENSKESTYRSVANVLKEQVEQKKYLDIGAGVERQLGISKEKLNTAAAMLKQEGYNIQYIEVEQATNRDKFTSVKVLTKDDVSYNELKAHKGEITSPQGVYFEDGGRTKYGIEPPRNINSDRIFVRYAEEGGREKDGVIELRPGVEDISLGQSQYAQIRMAVDGTHYLKGMAIYSKDIPEGYDIVFNSHESKGTPKAEVFKPLKSDPDNPFGSNIDHQVHYIDKNGKEQLSAANIVNDDTTWGGWKKTLSSQFLSKQSPMLAKRQLDISYAQNRDEFETIKSLTNPVIKRQLLQDFADNCDSSAVHLKAAALPRQATHVILPVGSLKDNEVYAPNYNNGEEVVLIRYPHGGIFEIPRLRVNNKNKEAVEVIGQAKYAIGINSNVASKLSGADFDGDTVVVIPTKGQKIKTMSTLEGLKNFNTDMYKNPPGVPAPDKKNGFRKQWEMGNVSNLITDMTIKGATPDEIARAVRHSMVIIDAEKHNLNYKQSALDNGIAQLKEKYQGGSNRGASTLISKASSEDSMPQIKDFTYTKDSINPDTGEKIFKYTGETYMKPGRIRKDGTRSFKETEKRTQTTKMAKAKDARQLYSEHPTEIEIVYGEYANKMKALGNAARKEWLATKDIPYNKTAKEAYSEEVKSLNSKINLAELNAPRERQAQLIARVIYEDKYSKNKDMSYDEKKKIKSQAIAEARTRTGANGKESRIDITDREWEAIQAGAISNTKLKQVVRYSDLDRLKELATPRESKGLTPSKLAMARAYLNSGYTQSEIAQRLGVSASTLNKALMKGEIGEQ